MFPRSRKQSFFGGGENMGMSNEQFDSYKAQLVLNLQRAQKEIAEKGKSETLDQVVDNLNRELKKP